MDVSHIHPGILYPAQWSRHLGSLWDLEAGGGVRHRRATIIGARSLRNGQRRQRIISLLGDEWSPMDMWWS